MFEITFKLCVLIVCVLVCGQQVAKGDELVGNVADLLGAMGYAVREHQVESAQQSHAGGRQPPVTLYVYEATNPTIGTMYEHTGIPVLFVHGLIKSSGNFMDNPECLASKPKDLRNQKKNSSDINKLELDPCAYSLPTLALNLGHSVWLFDRRPVSIIRRRHQAASQAADSPPSSTEWKFSLDEQAQYDLPAIIDFVLAQTNTTKLAAVCHSAGGSIQLMSLAQHWPQMQPKLSGIVLWAPSFSVGSGSKFDSIQANTLIGSIMVAYLAPFPPKKLLQLICGSILERQIPFIGAMCVARLASATPSSGREIAQHYQAATSKLKSMHKLSYGPVLNWLTYGSATPPAYNLSAISLPNRVSIYVGDQDYSVAPEDAARTSQQLKFDHKFTIITGTSVPFEHNSYFTSPENGRAVNIPSIMDIRRFQQLDQAY